MKRSGRTFPAIAPLTLSQFIEYAVRAGVHWLRPTGMRVERAWRAVAWRTALVMLTITPAIIWRPRPPPPPDDAAIPPTEPDRLTITERGVRVRDKRRVAPDPPPTPSPEAPPVRPRRLPRVRHGLLLVWAAPLGWLLISSARRTVPGEVGATDLGRQLCLDADRRAIVADRRAEVALDHLLELANDDSAGDWRWAVSSWTLKHVDGVTRSKLVARSLTPSAAIGGRSLTVAMRIAAGTAAALPDTIARAVLGTALTISRRAIDPYAFSGDVIVARTLVVRLLTDRPELDDVVRSTLLLRAGTPAGAGSAPELRLLALAVRERTPDAGRSLMDAAQAAGIGLEELLTVAERADRPLQLTPPLRTAARARAPLARAGRIVRYVSPWLAPFLLSSLAAVFAQRYHWTKAPHNVPLAEAIATLALLATVNVFTVELSANRLPGVVARFAGQPASLRSSYSAALALLVLAFGPGTPARMATGRSWAGVAALVTFIVTLLLALFRFLRRTDAAVAAEAYVRLMLPQARAAGRRFGRWQARAATLADALHSHPSFASARDEVHGEWQTLLVAPHRGVLAPRRRDLRRLFAHPDFAGGSLLRLSVGLAHVIRAGEHLGAIVPAADQRLDPRLEQLAYRQLRLKSSTDVENIERGCVALVQLALTLSEAGDTGTAERVARSAIRLIDAHTAAARGARLAGFRRAELRAEVTADGVRSDGPEAQASRRQEETDLLPVVPALRAVVRVVARAQLGDHGRQFDVSTNLLIPLLDATTGADGAVASLPLVLSPEERRQALLNGHTELLRLVGVRALELGADMPWWTVLRELDRLAADPVRADAAIRTTSVLAATASRFAGRHGVTATMRITDQVARTDRDPAEAAILRRRALWRAGAAGLAVGTWSVAVTVAMLLRSNQDLDDVVADTQDESLLDREVALSDVYGGYLGRTAKDALANFGPFLGRVRNLSAP